MQYTPQPLQRKLQAVIEKKAAKVPKHTAVNLFSFKKAEQLQATQRSQIKENTYYIRPSQSQKQSLRKFNSLVNLRSQESTDEDSQRCSNASRVMLPDACDSRKKKVKRLNMAGQ